MSDIPDPFAPFDIFLKSTTTAGRKKKLHPIKNPEIARPIIKLKCPALQLSWAKDAD